MARGVNKVILIGNLGQDPDVRTALNTGDAMGTLSVATSDSWTDKACASSSAGRAAGTSGFR